MNEYTKKLLQTSGHISDGAEVRHLRSNIMAENITKRDTFSTLQTLTVSLSKSLGPYGSTTILEDRLAVNHTISKDGYTILNKIKFAEELPSTILEIVKKVSRNLVKEVGDGSTSAIVISDSLYQNLNTVIEHFPSIPRKDIIDSLEVLQTILSKKLKDKATPITESNFDVVEKIATISNNNDKASGKLIHEIYSQIGGEGFISLTESNTDDDNYTITKGIELTRGYINNIFANKPDKVTCEFERPLIMLSKQTIDETELGWLSEIVGSALKQKRPIVIISKGFDPEIRNFLTINKHQNRELDIVAVDYALAERHHEEAFEDLAAYIGAVVYDKYSGVEFDINADFGLCNKFITDDKNTKIIEGVSDDVRVKERLELINAELSGLEKKDKFIDTDQERFRLLKRIADLNCQIATLRVGGKTQIEKETRKYLMEDAVFACRSAIRNGYVTGGNLEIPRIITKSFEDIVDTLVHDTSLIQSLDLKDGKEGSRVDFFNEFVTAVSESFEASFLAVLQNRINDLKENKFIINKCLGEELFINIKTGKYEKLEDTDVINSVETDIQIMKAAFSIIGLLATSNQFISTQVEQLNQY